jgi:hypothetical protein
MGNHVHLLLREGVEPLSQIFRRLGTRYVQWFNRKYERSGHLFQDRYHSDPVEDDRYFLTVILYIYQNPVKAGIYYNAKEYEWCSRRFLGDGDSLIDETALAGVVSVSVIKQREHELIEDKQISGSKAGRRAAFADKEVSIMFRQICGVQSSADFQRLPRDTQKSAVVEVRSVGVPLRQIARITGMSKGLVEYWCKK